MAGEEAGDGKFKFYHYDPNLATNVIFVVLFAIAGIGHVVLLVRHKTWYFIPFVVGCIFEAIGYVGRVISATETPDWTLTPYLMQTLLILLGPALFAASIYMILARLVRLLDAEEYALISTRWMTKVFVTGDVLSFLGQGAGGGLMAKAKTPDDQKMGENIILGGLGIQVVFFGFFIVTILLFHTRMARNPTPRSYSVTGPWRTHVFALYACSALILVRSVFRMVEFGMGNESELMRREVYLLALDGALMVLVAAILLWSHPARALRGYKDALPSVEVDDDHDGRDDYESGGRNTAESFQMLTAGPHQHPSDAAGPAGTKRSLAGSRGEDGGHHHQPRPLSRGPAGAQQGYYDVIDIPPRSDPYSSSYGK